MIFDPSTDSLTDLASAHGLEIDPGSVQYVEAGLDYRVAFATGNNGEAWVLRLPRRADVSDKIQDEARILEVVRPALTVAVPDWRIHTRSLIAYPRLPGEPGLTISESGEPRWHFDRESLSHARSLGRLTAELHRIDVKQAHRVGVPAQTPAEARAEWKENLAKVKAEFEIDEGLVERLEAWLAETSYWPEVSVLTHGELYPAHLLLDGHTEIVSVLDWTTAKVGDPALDFMFQHAMSSPESFQATVDAYVAMGGQVWPRLGEHCAHLMAAGPINYAVYALVTGNAEHCAAAAAQLSPQCP